MADEINPQQFANVVNTGTGWQKVSRQVPNHSFLSLFGLAPRYRTVNDWRRVQREGTNTGYDDFQAALRGQQNPVSAPAPTVPTAPAQATPATASAAPPVTPVSAHGVNDTGRTLPFNPIPTMPNYQTTNGASGASGAWAGAGAPVQTSGGGTSAPAPVSSGFGILSALFGGGFGGTQKPVVNKKGQVVSQPYEAALRERPADIQGLVSMSRQPGFTGFRGGRE